MKALYTLVMCQYICSSQCVNKRPILPSSSDHSRAPRGRCVLRSKASTAQAALLHICKQPNHLGRLAILRVERSMQTRSKMQSKRFHVAAATELSTVQFI